MWKWYAGDQPSAGVTSSRMLPRAGASFETVTAVATLALTAVTVGQLVA